MNNFVKLNHIAWLLDCDLNLAGDVVTDVLEQRDELLEACQFLFDYLETEFPEQLASDEPITPGLINARAAIANAIKEAENG